MKLNKTPKQILDTFEAYVEHCRNTPFIRQQASKKGVVDIKVPRPVTLMGFCSFAGFWSNIFTQKQFDNIEGDDVREALARVRMAIESDALSGAQAGVYNASIVSRLLNLVDRQDVTSGDNPIEAIAVPASIIIKAGDDGDDFEIKGEDI